MNSLVHRVRTRLGGPIRIGIGISQTEIRLVVVGRTDAIEWTLAVPRDRDQSLSTLITASLGKYPAKSRGGASVACTVGPSEGQLRPLRGLPQLRSASEQNTLIAENVDRFFVSDGARMRTSVPSRVGDADFWAAAVPHDIVSNVAAACRALGLRFVGAAPIAAAIRRLVPPIRVTQSDETIDSVQHVTWTDEGTRLHIEMRGTELTRIWRERATSSAPRGLSGMTELPDTLEPSFGDAFAATQLRASDQFIVSEHTDDQRLSRRARQRTVLWTVLAAAGMVACAWLPGATATGRAERTRSRLTTLSAKTRELGRVQTSLANATASLNGISAFERSRRSATVFLAELALALPDSTALTALRVDSVGGTITVLAPHAAAALEAVTEVPGLARVQLSGAVTREVAGGIQLERASLRFAFARKATAPRPTVRTAMVGTLP